MNYSEEFAEVVLSGSSQKIDDALYYQALLEVSSKFLERHPGFARGDVLALHFRLKDLSIAKPSTSP